MGEFRPRDRPGRRSAPTGGGAGMGRGPARRARAEGADVILAGRNPDRLERAAAELGARSSAAIDPTDSAALDRVFAGLPETIDHVMGPGPRPYYAPQADPDRDQAHPHLDDPISVARTANQ